MNDSRTIAIREAVHQRIKLIMEEVKKLLNEHQDKRIHDSWNDRWSKAFHKIIEERKHRPQVEISLVGGTGSGKSTLVNALLGARILPVSNMRACTAAISEVAYAEGDQYRATVEFVSRESWHEEINCLLEDIRDCQSQTEANDQDDTIAIPRVARDKLAAVYGPWETNELPSLAIADYKEPPEIAEALSNGISEVATTSLDDFRKAIREYLDSSCRFWPIVKSVKLAGPFQALECGAKLIDLPGINDPNAAREKITRQYLKECRFVWIVFNIKRVLTKDVSNLMQGDDFVRQIVMDGRENALTFVGTASDDIDVDSAWEEFGLDEDAEFSALATARNEAAQGEINKQIADIADRIARNAGETKRASGLREAFLASRVFTVSARDYLALSRLAKNRPQFTSIAETQIDELREHMVTITADFGVEAQALAHHARINHILNEIKAEVARSRSAIDQQCEMSLAKRKELSEAVTRLASFLRRDLEDYQARFSQDLRAGHDVLAERIKRAIDRARYELDHIVAHWNQIHWATLRAISRRGGAYLSPTSGEHDFSADITRPILNGIAFAWSDFFGERLTSCLEKWSDKLITAATRHGLDVLRAVSALNLKAQSKVETDFKSVFETTEKVMREQLGQTQVEMNHRINEVRRKLYNTIPEQVENAMNPSFSAASEEEGAGMKKRMLVRISKDVEGVSQDMFADIEESLGVGVRSLTNWLCDKFGEMTDTIKRHTQIPMSNLMEQEGMSTQELKALRKSIEEVSRSIDALPMVELQSLRPDRQTPSRVA